MDKTKENDAKIDNVKNEDVNIKIDESKDKDEIDEKFIKIEEIEGTHKIDIAELLKKVRQEEKAKLYKDIEKMKEKIKSLTEELGQHKELLMKKDNEKLSEQQLLLKQQEELSKEVVALKAIIEKNQEEAREKIRMAELNAYKQKKISEAGGKIIPEMVAGNSEEEIDESYIKAVQYYMQIKDDIINELKNSKKSIEMPTSTVSTRPSVNKLSIDDIKKMSTKDWAKYREEILGSISSM